MKDSQSTPTVLNPGAPAEPKLQPFVSVQRLCNIGRQQRSEFSAAAGLDQRAAALQQLLRPEIQIFAQRHVYASNAS